MIGDLVAYLWPLDLKTAIFYCPGMPGASAMPTLLAGDVREPRGLRGALTFKFCNLRFTWHAGKKSAMAFTFKECIPGTVKAWHVGRGIWYAGSVF